MSISNLAKGVLTVPAITAWVDLVKWQAIWETIWYTAWAVDAVLNLWNSYLNPLFQWSWLAINWVASAIASPLSAMYLSNKILWNFNYFNNHKKLRYLLNTIAWTVAFSAGTAAAPYLLGGAVWYALWKPVYNFTKGAINKIAGTAWWLTGWAAIWAYRWAVNWMKNWFSKKPI